MGDDTYAHPPAHRLHPDRRTVLKGLAVGAAAAGGLQALPSGRAGAAPPALNAEGATLDSTVVRGSAAPSRTATSSCT